jgi:hypothetical protein
LVLCGGTVEATTYYVDASSTAQTPDGTSWQLAYQDLQDLLQNQTIAWQIGDEIHVAKGRYIPHASDRTVSFELISGVVMKGGYPEGGGDENDRDPASNHTILSGDLNDDDVDLSYYVENSYHVVHWDGETAPTLDGFYIEHGYADEESGTHSKGAGIFAEEDLNIHLCFVRENWAHGVGGGLYLTCASLATISDCEFYDNRTSQGGAAYINSDSRVVMSGTTISANEAGRGSGLYLAGSGDTTLFSCTLFGNRTYPWLTGSHHGAGVFIASGHVEVTNCVFDSNRAWNHGGAVYHASQGGLALLNSTFYVNSARLTEGGLGGGVYQTEDSTITNCIFWRNHDYYGFSAASQIRVGTSTATVTFSCIDDDSPGLPPYPFGGAENNNIDEDPDFVNPGHQRDLRLDTMYCYSPCINVGSNTAIAGVDTDRDGNPRVVHEIVDMGAYEVQDELGFCCTEELEDPPACMGDANGDKTVGPADVALVKFYYGSTDDEALCRCDINCNGTIDPQDVGLVKLHYGVCIEHQSPRPCYEEY